MTNEEIISKLIELGQNMYYAYSYLKDDASKVKSAMEEWHKFVTPCMQKGRVLPGMEQIDIGVAWRDYVPVDAFEECERYGKWKIVPVEPTHPVTKPSDQVESEDLEEELERFAKLYPQENAGSYRNLITLARHFANWQYKKDEAEIDRAYKTVDKVQYRNGWKDCHDTMMKNAVNATLSGCWSDLIGGATFDKPLSVLESEFNMGDKVKILIIKKDGTVSNPPLK